MLYNLLFSPSFNKDFSHLMGPPVDKDWERFKKGTYGYIIQTHSSGSGDKNFYFISNTNEYLAFGIYASIHHYASINMVDQKYKLRRRGGDHSAKADGAGDYPTEAALGWYWKKSEGNIVENGQYIDISVQSMLKMFEEEIVPYWDRPRTAISAREHITKTADLAVGDRPFVDFSSVQKEIQGVINGSRDLIKVDLENEEAMFYGLVHAALHNKINGDFNFCSDFNNKAFKGQKVIDIGTTRVKGLFGKLFKKNKSTTEPIQSHGTGDFVADTNGSANEVEEVVASPEPSPTVQASPSVEQTFEPANSQVQYAPENTTEVEASNIEDIIVGTFDGELPDIEELAESLELSEEELEINTQYNVGQDDASGAE